MTRITDVTQESSDSSMAESDEVKVRKFAKHMLRSTLFVGAFQEKRYVEPLDAYRDVVKISDEETEFVENLEAVKKRCAQFFSPKTWIGVTGPDTVGAPAGHSLWVTLAEEVFGSYWFKVKRVEFHRGEVRLRLETVRPYTKERAPIHNVSAHGDSINLSNVQSEASTFIKSQTEHFFAEILTFANVKEAAVFICLLVSTVLTFLVHAAKYLMEYSLKLLRELSGLVKAFTPFLLASLRCLSQMVNGFYGLIAHLFRGDKRPPPDVYLSPYVPPQFDYRTRGLPGASPSADQFSYSRGLPSAGYGEYLRRSRFESRPRSSVRITPLD